MSSDLARPAWGTTLSCVMLLAVACGGDATSPEPQAVTPPPGGQPVLPLVPPTPSTSTLVVKVATSGVDIDEDGYRLVGSSGLMNRVGTSGEFSFTVGAGRTHVDLSDVAENCTLDGDAARDVDVPMHATAPVEFRIACRPWPEQPGGADLVAGEWRLVRFEHARNPDFSESVENFTGADWVSRLDIARTGDASVHWSWDMSFRGTQLQAMTGTGRMLSGGVLRSSLESGLELLYCEFGDCDSPLQGDLRIERNGDRLVIRSSAAGYIYDYIAIPVWTRLTFERVG